MVNGSVWVYDLWWFKIKLKTWQYGRFFTFIVLTGCYLCSLLCWLFFLFWCWIWYCDQTWLFLLVSLLLLVEFQLFNFFHLLTKLTISLLLSFWLVCFPAQFVQYLLDVTKLNVDSSCLRLIYIIITSFFFLITKLKGYSEFSRLSSVLVTGRFRAGVWAVEITGVVSLIFLLASLFLPPPSDHLLVRKSW